MDADEIFTEVKKRKERAKELGIANVACSLFDDHFKYYPRWIKSERDRHLVYPTVEEAIEGENGQVKITLNRRTYTFEGTKSDNEVASEYFAFYKLKIGLEETWVFACTFGISIEKLPDRWFAVGIFPDIRYQLVSIDAFIEGDWVDELKQLHPLVLAHSAEQNRLREKRRNEEPEKLADLKKRFGID